MTSEKLVGLLREMKSLVKEGREESELVIEDLFTLIANASLRSDEV